MSLQFRGKEIKYIISDLDGTLLQGEGHTLEDEYYDLIKECLDQDVPFIVASGRTYENEQLVLKPVMDRISYIANSGSIGIYDGKEIFNHRMDEKTLQSIIDIVHSIDGCSTCIATPTNYYTDSFNEPFMEHMRTNVKMELKLVDDISQIQEPIDKISVFYDGGSDRIKSQFENHLENLHIVRSGPKWLDFLIPNVNKGQALKEMLNYYNINIEDGIAFGDQENDIEMIDYAGIGCCMKTGVPNAKAVADLVIESPKSILKEMLGKK